MLGKLDNPMRAPRIMFVTLSPFRVKRRPERKCPMGGDIRIRVPILSKSKGGRVVERLGTLNLVLAAPPDGASRQDARDERPEFGEPFLRRSVRRCDQRHVLARQVLHIDLVVRG